MFVSFHQQKSKNKVLNDIQSRRHDGQPDLCPHRAVAVVVCKTPEPGLPPADPTLPARLSPADRTRVEPESSEDNSFPAQAHGPGTSYEKHKRDAHYVLTSERRGAAERDPPSRPNSGRGRRQEPLFPRLSVCERTAGDKLARLGAQGWDAEGGAPPGCCRGKGTPGRRVWYSENAEREAVRGAA